MKFTFITALLVCLSLLSIGCNKSSQPHSIVIAKNGLPSVISLISKPELNELFKKKYLSENDAAKLTSELTGYNEKSIEIALNFIKSDDVDFDDLWITRKFSSISFSDETYNSIVTATAASMLINGHQISEAGDTKAGCVLKSIVPPLGNIFSISGATITIWIEKQEREIIVYGLTQGHKGYEILGINDKRLSNIFDGINKYLGKYPSFKEINN